MVTIHAAQSDGDRHRQPSPMDTVASVDTVVTVATSVTVTLPKTLKKQRHSKNPCAAGITCRSVTLVTGDTENLKRHA
jgi:hypothetical protein